MTYDQDVKTARKNIRTVAARIQSSGANHVLLDEAYAALERIIQLSEERLNVSIAKDMRISDLLAALEQFIWSTPTVDPDAIYAVHVDGADILRQSIFRIAELEAGRQRMFESMQRQRARIAELEANLETVLPAFHAGNRRIANLLAALEEIAKKNGLQDPERISNTALREAVAIARAAIAAHQGEPPVAKTFGEHMADLRRIAATKGPVAQGIDVMKRIEAREAHQGEGTL